MSTSQKRDADMDRLLRGVLRPAHLQADATGLGTGPDCPDAGLLAAFAEGGLTATEQAALDSHIVNCGRCQETIAIIAHELPAPGDADAAPPETGWFTWVARPRLRWLVPISAVATVAAVIFATRPLIAPEQEMASVEAGRMAQAPAPPAELPEAAMDAVREKSAAARDTREVAGAPERLEAAPSLAAQPPRPKRAADAPAPSQVPAAGASRERKQAEPAAEMMAASVVSEEQRAQPAAPAPAPPAAADRVAAAAPTRLARNLEGGLVTVSAPGGEVRWRFGVGGQVARSNDAGATWHEQASAVTADLLAGAAPSPAVCWIVGAAGTVLITTDGGRWERRPFPLAVDLVAVEASSARTAAVTTRDGRRFDTLDAGLTWSPKR